MQITEALQFDALKRARLVAGQRGIDRELRWVHVVDLPDPAAWVQPGMLLLTTGYAWPREEGALRALTRALAERQIAGVGLAVPQFFERCPAAMCEEANLVGLPLLEIPWEIPFAQIAEELLQALVVQQYRQIEQSEAIHRALTSAAIEAESLQDIAEALGRLLDRAVTIEDGEGNLLAVHRLPTREDSIRRRTLEEGHTPPEYERFLEEHDYMRQIASASGPIRIPAVPEVGATGRVVCPIRIRHELVGRAWIIEGARPLDELDLRAAEQAAFIAALHILHQRELGTREARVGYAFLDSLLEGHFTLTPQAIERAQLLGFDQQGVYHVGLFVLHVPLPISPESFQRRERLAARVRTRLQRGGAPALVSMNGNQVPFLLPRGADGAALWQDFAVDDLSLTLSRAYAGIQGIQQGYREVQALTPLLRPGEYSPAAKLLLPRVLSGDRGAQNEFLDELFGPLKQARNGETLIETLLAFANNGFHLGHTAQKLYIHPKTLSYRLNRISEIATLNLNDAETRFKIQLAGQLRKLA